MDIQIHTHIEKFFALSKAAASALYSTDETRKIIEHENGGYSAWASKVNVGNGVF